MVQYAGGTRCRQQLLLEYFGEPDAPACGVCDVCLARKKARQEAIPLPELRAQLLELVKAAPQTPREVLTHYAPGQASAVTALLRDLVELGELRYAADGRLSG